MRLFVVGVGPLPFYRSHIPQNSISEGTWQMVQPLLEDGHTIRAVTLEFGQKEDPKIEYIEKPSEISPNLEHQYYPEPLRQSRKQISRQVQISLAAFKPDAVISAGSMIAAWVTTQLKHRLPLWYDLKGAFMPELQLRLQSPDAEDTFETCAIYKQVLMRGDRFSAVTERQAHMVMGELGMVGRLNPGTLGEDLVTVKPSGIPPDSPSRMEHTGRIRGRLCGNDDFVLFSSGGFNTWQDTRTFYETIERVLQANPKACFVCIGGGIGGHFDRGYNDFKGWVEAGPVRDRCFLEGWVPQNQVIEYESEADLAINCDRDIPESRYGDRSRFLSWMARRVVVATTPVSQPSEMLVEKELAVGLPVGDPKGASDVILRAMEDRDRLREMAQRAEGFVRKNWSFRETTRDLREWAAHPVLAGDNRQWFEDDKLGTPSHLASLELALDFLWHSDDRKEEKRPWKKVESVLRERWPWPDGRRWPLGRKPRSQ
jgi:glycosyltransferase involved in cell wall biosynthesis